MHRLVQTLLKQTVDVPHGVFAQPWVFRTSRAMTAEAFSLLQKLSDPLHCQFRELYIPQPRENMIFEEIAMGCIGSRTALFFVTDLLPAEDILSQCHSPTFLHWRCKSRKATHGSPACFRIRLCR